MNISLSKSKKRTFSRLFKLLSVDPSESKKIALTWNYSNLNELASKLSNNIWINDDFDWMEKELEDEVGSVTLFQDTYQLLEKIKKRGMQIWLISNLATPFKKPVSNLWIKKFFDHITFSCDAWLIKPNWLIYQNMIKKMWVEKNRVVMIWDNLTNDVIVPASIWINTILLDRNGKHKNVEQTVISSLKEINKLLNLD